jgi:hypothetical protein
MPIPSAEKRFRPIDDVSDIAPAIFIFDANRGVTDAGGGAVSAWNDLSGNNFHMTQSTAGSRPALVTNADGFGNDCIRFDGTADFLESTAVTPMNTLLTRNKWSYVAVVKSTVDTGGIQYVWSKYDTDANNRGPGVSLRYIGVGDYRNSYYTDIGSGGQAYLIHGNTNTFNTQSIIYGAYPGSAAGTLYLNGALETNTTVSGLSGVFTGNTENLYIGKVNIAAVGSNFLGGDLYYAALFQGVLDGTQLSTLFSRLSARYQISIA